MFGMQDHLSISFFLFAGHPAYYTGYHIAIFKQPPSPESHYLYLCEAQSSERYSKKLTY